MVKDLAKEITKRSRRRDVSTDRKGERKRDAFGKLYKGTPATQFVTRENFPRSRSGLHSMPKGGDSQQFGWSIDLRD
jgi:hypothetical protein